MISILIRKAKSLISHIANLASTFRCYFWTFWDKSIAIDKNCSFGHGVVLVATDGGSIMVENGSRISEDVQIIARGGRVHIGKDVFIGIGVIVVGHKAIIIGDDSLVAEYVVIRDQDHRTDSIPIRSAGFLSSPITIGKDVWIGCKATILRGVNIGEHSVVAAHSVVNKDVPAGVVVAGAPARIVKNIN